MKRGTFLTLLSFIPFLKLSAKHRSSFLAETCKTERDVEGPFYKKGAPLRSFIEKEGTKLTIRGRILNASDCSTPVSNAVLDIWHCDNTGKYDNDGFRCRGMVNSDANGEYSFTTIYPPSYGSRPRHIHVKVRAKGFNELTSQIYFKNDPNIRNDFARNADASRIIEVKDAGNGLATDWLVYSIFTFDQRIGRPSRNNQGTAALSIPCFINSNEFTVFLTTAGPTVTLVDVNFLISLSLLNPMLL